MNTIVRFDDAAVTYGRRTIWSGATFGIEPGTFTAIVGPNGAGKTTLIRTMLGLTPLSHGTVQINGRSPARGVPAVGYVPQRRAFDAGVPVRGTDVVQFGIDGPHWGMSLGRDRRSVRRRVAEALAAVHAEGFAERRIGTLSGGEAQRIAIAQAIVGEPSVLVLDEPFAGLDIASQASVAALIHHLVHTRGLTALLVVHNLNGLLDMIDGVVAVAGGRVRYGRVDELVTSRALSEIYASPVEVVRNADGRRFVVGLAS